MVLLLQNVAFSYANKTILNRISLHLQQGKIGTLIGASGSGKSTLFKLITGLLPVQEGYISIFEQQAPQGCQHIAYMMQQDMLLPWRTVLNNLLLVTELGAVSNNQSKRIEKAKRLLAEVDLSGCEDLYPDQLSGGMRQRVSLARALMQGRPLLLLDEPFGALDVSLREQMYQLLQRIKNKFGTTILMITHDFRDALSLSDQIFLLTKEGSILKEWSIESSQRQDFQYIGALQLEMQQLLSNY